MPAMDFKKKLYITPIRPTVTYGAETWASRKIDESRLLVVERKMLRRSLDLLRTMQ